MILRLAVSVLISAVLLYLTLRQFDLAASARLLSQTNVWLVILAVLVHFVGYLVRSQRWAVVLSPFKKVSATELFPIINIGYMANNVLPFRLGELVRLQITARTFDLSRSLVMSTVIVERLMDGLTLVSFLALFLMFSPVPDQFKVMAALSGTLLFSALMFFLALLYLHQSRRIKEFALKIPLLNYSAVKSFIKAFISGLEALRQPKLITFTVILSILTWLIESLMTYYVALSISLEVNYLQVIFLTAVINLSTMIPSAPGYFGTFEFFTYQALSLFGVGKTEAVTFAALAHLLQWAPVTIIGFLFSFKYNFSLKSLRLKFKPN